MVDLKFINCEPSKKITIVYQLDGGFIQDST